MRVWYPQASVSVEQGSVIDLMAKVDTKDGQRLLGMWNANPWIAEDITSEDHSLEVKVLASSGPHLNPVGIINRDLGGKTIGNNPGVTTGQGLYNIGSLVTTWGKVLDRAPQTFGGSPFPKLRIHDGSNVSVGSAYENAEVIVFGCSTYDDESNVNVDDRVSVTGVSSVWKPDGSSTTYRSVWVPPSGAVLNVANTPSPSPIARGTLTGKVKLYDMPGASAQARLYSACGQAQTLTIERGYHIDINGNPTATGDNSGSREYSLEIISPSVVSAQSDGFKMRTYTGIEPPATRNLYLVPLRKIYVTTENTSLDPCLGGANSTVITATVVDAHRQPVTSLVAVRFRTNKGSFAGSGPPLHETPPINTVNGVATATLYAVPSEWGEGIVEATDDSAPLPGDGPNDDPYKYDWIQVHNQFGQPITIEVGQPSTSLDLAADPTSISRCGGDMSTIIATVGACGSGVQDVDVSFSTDRGVFDETGTNAASAPTNGSGIATVHLKASTDGEGTANVVASASVYGIPLYTLTPLQIAISHDKLILTANPYSVPPSQTTSLVTAKLTTPSGAGISDEEVTFTPTPGSVNPTSGLTNSDGEVSTTLSGIPQGGFAVVKASTTNRCNETVKQRCQVDFLQTASDDWPMFMHDPRHQGYSRFYDTTTTENLTLVWPATIETGTTSRNSWVSHPLGGKSSYIFPHPYIDSSPIHAAGCPVIVGAWASGSYDSATTGYIAAFNPTTGASAWRYPASGFIGGVASTPCIAEIGGVKRVYIGSMDGRVYCLNAATGAFVWSYQTTNSTGGAGKILASPTVYGGRVYIGNESAKMYCLDAANGSLKWSYQLLADSSWPDRTGVSSVAIGVVNGETRAYVGSDKGHVYCLSTADSPPQRVIWDYAGEDGLGVGCVESSPTLYAGNVYVGTSWVGGRDVLALDAETGQLIWYQGLEHEARATAAAADGHGYIGVDTGHRFHKLISDIGEWVSLLNLPPDNYFVGSAALCAANLVFVGNDNGNFYALQQSDLSIPLSTYNTSGIICSSPAISYAAESGARWVYVVTRGNNGKLLAFRTQL